MLSSSGAELSPLESAGYYTRILMTPNGEFLAGGKVSEDKVKEVGFVYKVEMGANKKLEKITAMVGDSVAAISWNDTLGNSVKFASLTVEYQDDFVKYNFKDAHGAS